MPIETNNYNKHILRPQEELEPTMESKLELELTVAETPADFISIVTTQQVIDK